MRSVAKASGSIAGALAAASIAAAPATAAEICVKPADGCAGGQAETVQAALDVALALVGPDTVRLPPGLVAGPGVYQSANPDNTVTVTGAGRDLTTVTSTLPMTYGLRLSNGATLTDLTVKQPDPPIANQFGLVFVDGTTERVGFVSTTDTESAALQGVARDIRSSGPALVVVNGTIEDVQITGGTLSLGTSDTIVRRARVVSPFPVLGQNRTVVISSSLFVATDATGPIVRLQPTAVANLHATSTLSNVTVAGPGGGCTGILASGDNQRPPPEDFAVQDLTIANTVVRGCATTLERTAAGTNGTANVTVMSSDIDLSPAAVAQSGAGTLTAGPGDGNVNADPLFVDLPGALHEPRFASPLVDRGLINLVSPEESATDLNGNARVVDGSGDGTATRDIGAFEYQRRAPVVTASASAATAEIGKQVTFNGSATEADPGETVTGLAWRFDDGAVATGADATHAFATPGVHTGTLTATDTAGAAGKATATVTVLPRPAVTSLKLSPASFRAAAKGGGIAARGPKRSPVGTTVTLAVNRPAAVTLRVQRVTTGRRSGKRCVAATRRNRRAKTCRRLVTRPGTLSRAAGAKPAFRFTGRLGRAKLAPGRYTLTAQVAGTPARSAPFTIVR